MKSGEELRIKSEKNMLFEISITNFTIFVHKNF